MKYVKFLVHVYFCYRSRCCFHSLLSLKLFSYFSIISCYFHSSIHSSHICHHCILVLSWQKFFRFGATIHSVGQRLKVKVSRSMNIWLHSGEASIFQTLELLNICFITETFLWFYWSWAAGDCWCTVWHILYYHFINYVFCGFSVVHLRPLGPLQGRFWNGCSTK